MGALVDNVSGDEGYAVIHNGHIQSSIHGVAHSGWVSTVWGAYLFILSTAISVPYAESALSATALDVHLPGQKHSPSAR